MTTPRVDPFADLAGLANRIAQQLKANPKDAQTRADLKYVQSLMPALSRNVSATDNPPQPPDAQQVGAGLSAIPGDIVGGIGAMVMHPIQTLGQMSGVANWGAYGETKNDPNATMPEKLDAWARATPLNAGYAPFRAFLESTGMKSDEPAPLSEQVRRGGDIAASLALSRVSPGKVAGTVVRTALRTLRIPRWMTEVQPKVAAVLGKGADPQTVVSVAESAIRNQLAKRGFSPENIEQLVATWKTGGKLPVSGKPPAVETPVIMRPGETITQTSPRGFEVNGVRETPPVPTTPTLAEMQGFRTAPLGKGPTLPWYPRGGQVEQGMAPPPASSPPALAPNQNQAFIEFLKGATSPGEASARVGTLKALGVLGPRDEAALLQMLGVR